MKLYDMTHCDALRISDLFTHRVYAQRELLFALHRVPILMCILLIKRYPHTHRHGKTRAALFIFRYFVFAAAAVAAAAALRFITFTQ